jgi:hypothetical protein
MSCPKAQSDLLDYDFNLFQETHLRPQQPTTTLSYHALAGQSQISVNPGAEWRLFPTGRGFHLRFETSSVAQISWFNRSGTFWFSMFISYLNPPTGLAILNVILVLL